MRVFGTESYGANEPREKSCAKKWMFCCLFLLAVIAAVIVFVVIGTSGSNRGPNNIADGPGNAGNASSTNASSTSDSDGDGSSQSFTSIFEKGWGGYAGVGSDLWPGFPSFGGDATDEDSLTDVPAIPWRSLKGPAAGAGIKIGSIYNDQRIRSLDWPAEEIAAYEELLRDNFDVITPENDCKLAQIYQSPVPDFSACDRVLDWIEANGLKTRFHVFAWGDWNPEWMTSLPPEEKRPVFIKYMREMLNHFKDRPSIIYWDVLNEAICDDVLLTPEKQNCEPGKGRTVDQGLLKGAEGNSAWYPDIPDYFDLSFQLAREVLGPDAILVYNDYGFESTNDPADADKNDRVYRYVAAALARGIPIDAIGFQLHIANIHGGQGVTGSVLFGGYMDGLREQFNKFANLGLQVHVTELDVGCSFPTLPCSPTWTRWNPSVRQRAQAAVFTAVLDVCLDVPACTVYQMWGSTDKLSWRDGGWDSDTGEAGTSDPDNSYNQHAHIFDYSMNPKLAAYGILATLLQNQK